ncbi:MAG: glycosyltransferase family 2 protein [Burkholderiales bacterium]
MLTVFTPTYNRADTLPRAYRSLKRQTSLEFIWLVVDDGSTDDTRRLVEEWRTQSEFLIEYFYQPNAGKHNAHNLAVSKTHTELFLILDADDELLPETISVIAAEWQRLNAACRKNIVGLWTLCLTPEGAACGKPFPSDRLDTSLQSLRYEHDCGGERLPCFTTEILRQYPFPTTDPGACGYIPEAYVWSAITRRHRVRCLNVPCRIYHPGPGLSEISRNEYQVSCAIVYAYVQPLANDLDWFWHAPGFFVFNAAQTVRYGLFSRTLFRVARGLSWPAKALLVAAFPIGLAVLARDYLSGRIARQLDPERYASHAVTQHADRKTN